MSRTALRTGRYTEAEVDTWVRWLASALRTARTAELNYDSPAVAWMAVVAKPSFITIAPLLAALQAAGGLSLFVASTAVLLCRPTAHGYVLTVMCGLIGILLLPHLVRHYMRDNTSIRPVYRLAVSLTAYWHLVRLFSWINLPILAALYVVKPEWVLKATAGFLAVVVGASLLMLSDGRPKDFPRHFDARPGDRIARSARLALAGTLILLSAVVLPLAVIAWLRFGYREAVPAAFAMVLPLALGWLVCGGAPVLQHARLRWLIARRGYGPRDYSEFLASIAEGGLLVRTGSAYRFTHKSIQDYLIRR